MESFIQLRIKNYVWGGWGIPPSPSALMTKACLLTADENKANFTCLMARKIDRAVPHSPQAQTLMRHSLTSEGKAQLGLAWPLCDGASFPENDCLEQITSSPPKPLLLELQRVRLD